MSQKEHTKFIKLGIITIAAVYLLILVGGIVRSTGSGMGCPDWPRCFGKWIPPTKVEELPENYKEIYSHKRMKKNERIASYIGYLGFENLAAQIKGDQSVYTELDFNAKKTWIEYLNRLLGAFIGVIIFFVLIYSYPFLKSDKSIFYLSFLSFVLVGFEGWLGSIVVSTNLLPFTVTVHMAVALLIVAILIYTIARAKKMSFISEKIANKKSLKILLCLMLVLTFVQIVIGTQVREEIDMIAAGLNYFKREKWISMLGEVFEFHRLLSILIFAVHAYFLYCFKNAYKKGALYISTLTLFTIMVLEILIGISMSYMNIPAYLQPLHLFFGTIIFGLQFFILIFLNFSNDLKNYQINIVKN